MLPTSSSSTAALFFGMVAATLLVAVPLEVMRRRRNTSTCDGNSGGCDSEKVERNSDETCGSPGPDESKPPASASFNPGTSKSTSHDSSKPDDSKPASSDSSKSDESKPASNESCNSNETHTAQKETPISNIEESRKLAKQATQAYKLQLYDEALEKYTEALSAVKLCDNTPEEKTIYLNRAAAYQKIGNHEATITDCDAVLAIDPLHPKALGRRGMSKRELGQRMPAFYDITAGLVLTPPGRGNAPPPVPEGYDELCLQVGTDLAKHELANGLSLKFELPASSEVSAHLSSFLTSPGDCDALSAGEDKTVEELTELLNSHTSAEGGSDSSASLCNRLELRLRRSLLLIAASEFGKAEADITAACMELQTASDSGVDLTPFPYVSELKNLRGTFLALLGNTAEAKRYLQEASSLKPNCCNALVKLAGLEMEAASFETAQPLYQQALRLAGVVEGAAGKEGGESPGIKNVKAAVDVYLSRGTFSLMSPNPERSSGALEDLQRCLDLDPGCAHAAMWLGVARYHMGQLEAAEKSFTQAVEAAPTLGCVYVFWGKTLMDREPEQALEKLRLALELDPTNSIALLAKASILFQQARNLEEVEATQGVIEKVLEVDPMCHGAHVELVKLQMRCGKLEEMLKCSKAGMQWCRTEAELGVLCSFYLAAQARLAALELKKQYNTNPFDAIYGK